MIKRSLFRASSRLACRCYATDTLSSASSREAVTTMTSENSEAKPTSDLSKGPPILQKIRMDLKTALQNKETVKLSVIRGLIDATRSKPIKSNIQMLALIKRARRDNHMVIEHYRAAGRQDLAEKQEFIVRILDEYSGSVETISPEIVKNVVEEIIEDYKSRNEKVMYRHVLQKALKSPKLPSDKIDKADVARVLKEVLPSSKSNASK